ncbi:MAG TPA: ABC transporter permease [Solirubrobacteraceae bacterium]|nr:ABC transporter permease [Solirubrobacteraceae bacterium]
MSVRTESPSGLSRDLGLVAWQIRYEQRSYWRNRGRGLFTFVFPLMFLVIFASLDRSAHIHSLGGISYDDFLVPGILAYAVITTTFVNLAISTAILRDEGVLKRMQGTPLPRWAYVAARIGSCALVMATITLVVVVAGVLFWGLSLRPATLPAIALTLLLGTAAFTTLGIGILRFVKNADTAPVIVNLLVLPLTFISNIWFPTNTLPGGLRGVASVFPIKPLASSLQYAFNPLHHGAAFDWSSLRALLIWAALGTFLMVRFLRRPLGDDVP